MGMLPYESSEVVLVSVLKSYIVTHEELHVFISDIVIHMSGPLSQQHTFQKEEEVADFQNLCWLLEHSSNSSK